MTRSSSRFPCDCAKGHDDSPTNANHVTMTEKNSSMALDHQHPIPVRPIAGYIFYVDQRLHVGLIILIMNDRVNLQVLVRDGRIVNVDLAGQNEQIFLTVKLYHLESLPTMTAPPTRMLCIPEFVSQLLRHGHLELIIPRGFPLRLSNLKRPMILLDLSNRLSGGFISSSLKIHVDVLIEDF